MTDTIQEKIIEEAKYFANTEIRPFAATFDEQQCIPRSLIDKMAAKGYLAASFPEEYGGLALDPVYYGLFTEAIGKACASVRVILTVHSSLVGETLLRWGTEDQKKSILPGMASGETLAAFALTEPEIGSDAKSIRTHYTVDGDYYVINGRKKWISLGDIADLFLVIARDNEKVTAFLVDKKTEGVTTTPLKGLMAGRATHLAEVELDNVKVHKSRILGKEGNGFTYIVNTALDVGRYSIAWGGLAIAQEALEAMVTYSRSRKQFGKGIHTFQLVQGMIGDAVTKLAAGRALCLRAGQLRKDRHLDAVIESTIAKYYTSKIANEIASDAVQIHGGNGFYNKYPAERLFREAKVLEIIEGTSQILQEVIANHGLARYNVYGKQDLTVSTHN